jgi:pimeloyl-ACP methyl ester carboxylesterase
MIQGLTACATVNTISHRSPVPRVVGLEDERFSSHNVQQGVWKPAALHRRAEDGVYFIERYESGRTPVLFIHGIYGSPRDFRFLIDSLDQRRFQPCVYFYASGARLHDIAVQLARELLGLRSAYGVEQILIVAHSMGGLIARDLLINQLHGDIDVPVLVTISTPWGGHAGASLGVRFAPVVVASWLDLASQSLYLQSLFADASHRPKRFPKSVRHHLIFTYGRRWSSLGASGDEVVTVASQLGRPAQEEASRIYGFNTTHARILDDEALAQRLSRIFSSHDEVHRLPNAQR